MGIAVALLYTQNLVLTINRDSISCKEDKRSVSGKSIAVLPADMPREQDSQGILLRASHLEDGESSPLNAFQAA